ncbi:MAG: hypothetical protein ACJ74J_09200 [Blastocatellia bacterium]
MKYPRYENKQCEGERDLARVCALRLRRRPGLHPVTRGEAWQRPFPIFRKILQKHGKQRHGLFARGKLNAYEN